MKSLIVTALALVFGIMGGLLWQMGIEPPVIAFLIIMVASIGGRQAIRYGY